MAAFKTTVQNAGVSELGNKAMVITVKKDDAILGHLMVGKASLHWFEKDAKKTAHKVGWEKLIEFLEKRHSAKATRP